MPRSCSCLTSCVATALLTIAFVSSVAAQADRDLRKNPPAPFEGTREAAMEIFLNPAKDIRERYAAGLRLVGPTDAESAKLLEFAATPGNDPDLRLLALAAHRSREKPAEVMLKILENPQDERPEFIVELVTYANRWFFVDPSSVLAKKATFVLRSRLEDENEQVRIRTFEGLLSRGDAKAVDLVTQQLKGTGEAKIPDYLAADYLRRADPRKHLGAFKVRYEKEVAKDQPEPKLVASLVKALSVDPELHPELITLMSAKTTNPSVKIASLDALSFYHAKDFPQAALEFLNDTDEKADVRKEAARTLLRFLNRGTNEEKDKHALPYARALKKVLESDQNVPEAVKEDVRKYQKSIYSQQPSLQERIR
jgi:HEAT repeat protein